MKKAQCGSTGRTNARSTSILLLVVLLSCTTEISLAESTSSASLAEAEALFWESIQGATDPAEFEAYLKQFPTGVYAELARLRRDKLSTAAAQSPQAKQASGAPEGTTLDATLYLLWHVAARAPENWEAAYRRCNTLATGAFLRWRLPSSAELSAVLPTIGPDLCTVNQDSGRCRIWSSDERQGPQPKPGAPPRDLAVVHEVPSGATAILDVLAETAAAVCVHDTNLSEAKEPFWLREAVLPRSGRLWFRDASPRLSHQDAEEFCRNLRVGGHSDWHLPAASEIRDLVDEGANRLYPGRVDGWGYAMRVQLDPAIRTHYPWMWVADIDGKGRFGMYSFIQLKTDWPKDSGLLERTVCVRSGAR